MGRSKGDPNTPTPAGVQFDVKTGPRSGTLIEVVFSHALAKA